MAPGVVWKVSDPRPACGCDCEPCRACNGGSRRKRPKRVWENPQYIRAVARMIRAAGRRCAQNENGLRELDLLKDVVSAAMQRAVDGLRAGEGLADGQEGCSWSEIGSYLGITKQAAQDRFDPEHVARRRERRRRSGHGGMSASGDSSSGRS